MPQQSLFAHEVSNGNQPQRTTNMPQALQQTARMAIHTKLNRQAKQVPSQPRHVQQQPKQYPQFSNQGTALAPGIRSESQENGQVRLFGWIGRYFEVKRTQSGVLRATFSIATPKAFRDPSGRSQKTTTWQRIVAWGSAAELLQERLQKGARVYIEGKLKTREWTDHENNLRTTTELVAQSVRFLDDAGHEMSQAA